MSGEPQLTVEFLCQKYTDVWEEDIVGSIHFTSEEINWEDHVVWRIHVRRHMVLLGRGFLFTKHKARDSNQVKSWYIVRGGVGKYLVPGAKFHSHFLGEVLRNGEKKREALKELL